MPRLRLPRRGSALAMLGLRRKRTSRSAIEAFAAERPRIIPGAAAPLIAMPPRLLSPAARRPFPLSPPLAPLAPPPSLPSVAARGSAPPSLWSPPFGRAAPLGSVCGSALALLALRAPKVAYGVPPSLRSSKANAHLPAICRPFAGLRRGCKQSRLIPLTFLSPSSHNSLTFFAVFQNLCIFAAR